MHVVCMYSEVYHTDPTSAIFQRVQSQQRDRPLFLHAEYFILWRAHTLSPSAFHHCTFRVFSPLPSLTSKALFHPCISIYNWCVRLSNHESQIQASVSKRPVWAPQKERMSRQKKDYPNIFCAEIQLGLYNTSYLPYDHVCLKYTNTNPLCNFLFPKVHCL